MPCLHLSSDTVVSFQKDLQVTRMGLKPFDTLLHTKLLLAINRISILTDTFDTTAKAGK